MLFTASALMGHGICTCRGMRVTDFQSQMHPMEPTHPSIHEILVTGGFAIQSRILRLRSACLLGTSFSYPTTVDLRPLPQPIGTSTPAVSVLIGNTSASVDIGISNIAIQGDFSESNNCPSTLTHATNCKLQVNFTPTTAGPRTGTITITDTVPGSPHVINLVGTGLVPGVQFSNFPRIPSTSREHDQRRPNR